MLRGESLRRYGGGNLPAVTGSADVRTSTLHGDADDLSGVLALTGTHRLSILLIFDMDKAYNYLRATPKRINDPAD